MKLVARLKDISEIKYLSQLGVDIFCLDTVLTTKKINILNLKSAIYEIRQQEKMVYILINKMIHEEDLSELKILLIQLKKLKVDGIVINDMTIYVLAKELGIEHLIIYQPGSLNTDSYSAKYFNDRKVLGITLSREITLEEIEIIGNLPLTIELSLIGHGYLDMFYSKRHLLSLYATYKDLENGNLVNNYNLQLKEKIRPDSLFPIFEDEYGTHIFRPNKLISLEIFNRLSNIIKTFFIERIFLTDEEYYDSVKLYTGKITQTDFLNKYSNYDLGFYFQRTEKIKGELNND